MNLISNPHCRSLVAVPVALTLTLLGACASAPWTVDSYAAPEGNVAARDTYFIKGGEIGTPAAVEPGLEQQLDADLRGAIRAELTHKGYTEVPDAASARMIVSYQVAGSRKFVLTDDTRVGAPSPTTVLSPSEMQPPPLSSVPREQLVRTGTVIVFVDDPANGRLLWRGLITAETRVGSPQEGLRVLTDMVRHITQDIPPHAGQSTK
jgi:hypothetical protein